MPSAESMTMSAVDTQEITNRNNVKKTVAKLALWGAAGIAAVTAPFAPNQEAPEKAQTTAIDTPARTPEKIINSDKPSSYIPELQAAEAEATVRDIVNYVAAVDFANKQKAVADLLQAIRASDAAAAASRRPVYGGAPANDVLACIRNRESGGDYSIYNSGGSGAAGAYQFMPGTWNSIASSVGRTDLVGVDPAQALPSDQDAMAANLYAQQGAAPWGGGC